MSKINLQKRIEELSKKWLNGTITSAEQEEFDFWYQSFQDEEVNDMSEVEFNQLEDDLYQAIQKRSKISDGNIQTRRPLKPLHVFLVAASIVLCVAAGLQIYKEIMESKQEQWLAAITPGRDRAVLSLDNGAVYDLDSLQFGESIDVGGVIVKKGEDGRLSYSAVSSSNTDAIVSTISTPNGGQYKILLPDGSEVWLNAASQLTFPSVFNGNIRKVELKGEAYFEVAHDNNMPFKVITPTEEVEVLGTHFNVKAYEEERASNVALLEGSVKVSVSSASSMVLKPGQQSVTEKGEMRMEAVDVSEAIAWKNGEFMFQNESMENVMKKIARWYDVETVLEPGLEDLSIWGSVSKYENIKEVLKIVEMASGAKFKVEGRRVYVTK